MSEIPTSAALILARQRASVISFYFSLLALFSMIASLVAMRAGGSWAFLIISIFTLTCCIYSIISGFKGIKLKTTEPSKYKLFSFAGLFISLSITAIFIFFFGSLAIMMFLWFLVGQQS